MIVIPFLALLRLNRGKGGSDEKPSNCRLEAWHTGRLGGPDLDPLALDPLLPIEP